VRGLAGRPSERSAFSSEHEEQKALIEWVQRAAKSRPGLARLYAIPNGGHRGKAAAGKAKAEGVRKGVLDLCLPVARGGWFGLYVEMKAKKGGQVSPEQHDELGLLLMSGYLCRVARGTEAAMEILNWYLAQEPTVIVGMRRVCPFGRG
jgi:hypothetical protein